MSSIRIIDDYTGKPCGTTNPLPVTVISGGGTPSTIFVVQQTATTSAAALPSQAMTNGAVCKALSTNTGTIYVGPSGVTTSNGYPLAPGEAISYAVANLSAIYIIGTNTSDVLVCTGN